MSNPLPTRVGPNWLYEKDTGAVSGIKLEDGTTQALLNQAQAAAAQALVSGAGNPAVGGAHRLFGNQSGAAGAGYTFSQQFPALAPFYGFRLIFLNYGTAQTITISKAAPAGAAGVSGTALTWSNVLFGGSASGSQAAGSGSGSNVVPSILVSDWVQASSLARTDSGVFPLLQARAYFAAASTQANINSNAQGDYQAATGMEFAGAIAVGDQVTTIAGMGPVATNTWMCPSGVDFQYGLPTSVIADVGDSLMRGQESSTTSNGWRTVSDRTAALKRSSTAIWQAASFCITGQGHAASYQTGLEVVSKLLPRYLCFRAWSPNDGSPTQALIDAAWQRTLALIEHCRRNNVTPVLCTTPPRNTLTAGEDAFLKVQNARVKALAGWVLVSDEAAVVEDPADRSKLAAAFNSGDGLHITSAGYDAMAVVRAASLTY